MADYRLTAGTSVIRTSDGAFIPDDPENGDRKKLNAWLAAGNVPDPHVQPEEPKLSKDERIDKMLEAHGLTIGDLKARLAR